MAKIFSSVVRFLKERTDKKEKRSNIDAWGPSYEITKHTKSRIPEAARFLFKKNEFAKEKVIMRDCGCKEYHYMVSEDRDLSRHWHYVLLFNREGEYVKLIQRVPPRGKRVQKIA